MRGWNVFKKLKKSPVAYDTALYRFNLFHSNTDDMVVFPEEHGYHQNSKVKNVELNNKTSTSVSDQLLLDMLTEILDHLRFKSCLSISIKPQI